MVLVVSLGRIKEHSFLVVSFTFPSNLCQPFGCASVVDTFASRVLGTDKVSKAWEELASVNVVGESIVIGRYQGGDISLKAALATRRYFPAPSLEHVCMCCAIVPA